MLNKDSVMASLPLASVLDGRGLALVPIDNTPLADLVKATRSENGFATGETGNINIDTETILYMANCKDGTGVCKHDTVLDDVVSVSAATVQREIMFARTVVTPALEELVNGVYKYIGDKNISSLLGLEVKIWNPPAPYYNEALEEKVCQFGETIFDIPKMQMKLPTLMGKEIIELMKVGAGDLDAAIDEWASAKGDLWFVNMWETFFQIKQNDLNDTKVVQFNDYLYSYEDQLDYALAVYLLSRRLKDDPLPGTEMNLSEYNTMLVDYRNQSALRMARAYSQFKLIGSSQQLIRSMTDKVITVNGDIYDNWIKNGGSNEILFGNLLSKPQAYTVAAINEKAATLKDIWDKHAILTASVEKNRRFNKTKEALLFVFTNQMRNVIEGDEANSDAREIIINRFVERLEKVKEEDIDDLWSISLKLLQYARFYKTEAERILSGIEMIKKDNPNVDVREAASISVLKYVAYWVSTQFKVVKAY